MVDLRSLVIRPRLQLCLQFLLARVAIGFALLAFLTLTSSLALAQGAPAAPAGGGGGGGGGATAAGGVAPAFSSGSGLGGDVFVPGTISPTFMGSTNMNPTIAAPVSSGSGMSRVISTCLDALSGIGNYPLGMGSWDAAQKIRDAADKANEEGGFQYPKGTDEARARRAGQEIEKVFGPGEQGCQKFIDKDGKVGPWGRTALEEMDRNKSVYEEKVPDDVHRYCPSFQSMDAQRRKYFWLWFFASISKPESGCKSTAVNPNAPNGSAIGLFQLEAPACARVGNYSSSSDLMDPHKNTRCAVAIIANEMRHRPTIFTDTSRGPAGTYFGTVRTDDHNRARQIDIGGGKEARALLANYTDCQR